MAWQKQSRGESECWNRRLYWGEKRQNRRLQFPTVCYELDRILERVFEQITDERSTAVQEYIDNLRAFAAQQDNALRCSKSNREMEKVCKRKDKLLDLAPGALSNDEFK